MVNLQLIINAVDNASGKFRGVGKEAGGLGKTLGDVGKIAGGFLAANVIAKGFSAMTKGFGDSLSLASSFNESLSKTRVVFGDSSKVVEDFAKKAAVNLGMANGAALEATSTFGNFLQAMGTAKRPATDMSMAMVTLAGDLASFNNASPEDVLLALRSGLSGEAEPMRKFGVALSETAVKAQASKMGIVGVNGVLTEAQKVQARYAIIMAQTTMAQGDFARTSDGAANKQRILAAKMDDVKTKVGQVLLPIKMLVMDGIIKLTDSLPKLKAAFDGLIPPATIASIKADLLPALKSIGRFLQSDVLPQVKEFGRVALEMGAAVAQFLAPSLDTLADLWRNALKPALDAILPLLETVGRFLLEHKEILIALAAAILLILNPWLAVVAVLAVVLAKWDEISQTFTKTIPDAINSLIKKVEEIPVIGEIFTLAMNNVKVIVETVFGFIKNYIQFQMDAILAIIKVVTALIHGDWGEAWQGVKDLFGAFWKLIKADISTAFGGVAGLVKNAMGAVAGVVGDIWEGVKAPIRSALNWIIDRVNEFASGINAVLGPLGGVLGKVGISVPKIPSIGHVGGGGSGDSASEIGRLLRLPGFAQGGFVPPGVVMPAILHGGTHGEDVIPRGGGRSGGATVIFERGAFEGAFPSFIGTASPAQMAQAGEIIGEIIRSRAPG